MVYWVNAPAFGMQQYRLLLNAKGDIENLRRKLAKFCNETPEIVSQIQLLGSWDFEIRFEVEDGLEANDMRQQICRDFGRNLAAVKMINQFCELKFALYPFAEDN